MRKWFAVLATALVAAACSGTPSTDGGVGPVGPVGPVDGTGSAELVEGSGNPTTVIHDLADFDRIELAGEGNVVVTIGDAHALTVRTDDNLHPYLDVTVVGTTLRLATITGANVDLEPTDSITWTVTVPAVTSLVLTGAGTIDAEGITTDRLEARLDGAGAITVTGTADAIEAVLNGVGSIDAGGLITLDGAAIHGGVGDLILHVTGTLEIVDLGSVGGITVTGSPTLTGDTGLVTQG